MGELKGGVTGALMDPPWMRRWGSLEDEVDDDADERCFSHGMRELFSGLFIFAV